MIKTILSSLEILIIAFFTMSILRADIPRKELEKIGCEVLTKFHDKVSTFSKDYSDGLEEGAYATLRAQIKLSPLNNTFLMKRFEEWPNFEDERFKKTFSELENYNWPNEVYLLNHRENQTLWELLQQVKRIREFRNHVEAVRQYQIEKNLQGKEKDDPHWCLNNPKLKYVWSTTLSSHNPIYINELYQNEGKLKSLELHISAMDRSDITCAMGFIYDPDHEIWVDKYPNGPYFFKEWCD